MSFPGTDPIAGIDAVNWCALEVESANASAIPALLRELVAANEAHQFARVLKKIRALAYYQGHHYSAIPATLYFLLRILMARAAPSSQEIGLLDLIIDLSRLGFIRSRWWATGLPSGQEWVGPVSLTLEGEKIVTAAVDVMLSAKDFWIEQLQHHPQDNFRCRCAYVLMFLPGDRLSTVHALQEVYSADVSCRSYRFGAAVLLGLSFLASHLEQSVQQDVMSWLILQRQALQRGSSNKSMLTIFAAACLYLQPPDATVLQELVAAIHKNHSYSKFENPAFRETVDMLMYAITLVMNRYAIQEYRSHESTTNASFFDFVKQAVRAQFSTHSLDIQPDERKYLDREYYLLDCLLQLAFKTPVHEKPWHDLTSEQQRPVFQGLSARQREALELCFAYPVWSGRPLPRLFECHLPQTPSELGAALALGNTTTEKK